MPIPSEKEPRRQFQKAPEGTYNFLEQYNGFETGGGLFGALDGWVRSYPQPFLLIEKEEVCDETGGSCMAFRLIRREGKNLLDIHGHITDNDEIVFLDRVIRKKGIRPPFWQKPDITVAMSEIRAIVPSPEQNQHTEGVSPTP